MNLTIDGVNGGSIAAADAFNQFKALNTRALKVFSDSQSILVPKRYEKSKETLVMANSYLVSALNHLNDFLDNSKTSTLANAQDEIQKSQQGIEILYSTVGNQAKLDGVTSLPSPFKSE